MCLTDRPPAAGRKSEKLSATRLDCQPRSVALRRAARRGYPTDFNRKRLRVLQSSNLDRVWHNMSQPQHLPPQTILAKDLVFWIASAQVVVGRTVAVCGSHPGTIGKSRRDHSRNTGFCSSKSLMEKHIPTWQTTRPWQTTRAGVPARGQPN